MAVNSAFFPYDHTTIYLARDRYERLPMPQGSGYYQFHLSDNTIATIEYNENYKELLITPLHIGHVRINIKSIPFEMKND